MAKTLTLLASYVEATAHRAEVAVSELLSPGLRRLVLRCPDFADATTAPCDSTAFRVSRNDFRHYTPALLDGDELTIVVQRHEHDGPTPGQDLIESWTEGDPVTVCKWASARAFAWDGDDTRPVVLFGDATVVSLAMSMAERAARDGRELRVVLEVAGDDVEAAHRLVPDATVLPAGDAPGLALDAWIAENVEVLRELEDPLAYLAGHGQSIQRQRVALRDEVGLHRKAIKTQPYWADGKVGL